jgi:hypothetical protein
MTTDLNAATTVEIDPNILITRDDLWHWLDQAALRADAQRHGSDTFQAIDQAILAARREGNLELGVAIEQLRELEARGLGRLAMRVLLQIGIDAGTRLAPPVNPH